MEIPAFLTLVIPFIIVIYLAVLLFLRAPRQVVLASLLAGLLASLINMAFDLLAYYAHWWNYTINNLILHLPLPFYISTLLFYGSIIYLLIWRFWRTRSHWFALLLLFGTPIVGFLKDLYYNSLTSKGYAHWTSPLAGPIDFLMWAAFFYAGYLLFKRLAPTREVVHSQEGEQAIQQSGIH